MSGSLLCLIMGCLDYNTSNSQRLGSVGEIDVRCRRKNKRLTNSGVRTLKVSLRILVAQALRQEFMFVYTFCRKFGLL